MKTVQKMALGLRRWIMQTESDNVGFCQYMPRGSPRPQSKSKNPYACKQNKYDSEPQLRVQPLMVLLSEPDLLH
jgi:hypothetical protein